MRNLRAAVLIAALFACASAHAQQPDTAAVDSALVEELARQMEADEASQAPGAQQSARGGLNSMNPEISVIGDFRSRYDSEADRPVDMEIHGVEWSFRSAIDPYARADVYLSAHPEDGELHVGLEEAYVTTMTLPYRLQAKVGKFRSEFGKINATHPHALPYIGLPIVYRNYFGEEGLIDQGVALSWLTPITSFYQEITLAVTRGPDENESFVLSDDGRLLYSGRLMNFWDLSDNSTLEIGVSGATGASGEGEPAHLGGLDATYIWRPVRYNRYRSLTLQSEAFFSRRELPAGEPIDTWGFYAFAEYQLSQRWFASLRYDRSDLPNARSWDETGVLGSISWFATEFQKLEAGIGTSNAPDVDRSAFALFRWIFVIGAHGAHEY